jgi:hypothetical protein
MSNYQADVLIVGGGPAGTAAALAVRRMGASVLLLEERPILGGVATGAMVHSMLTFHGKKGHRVVGGVPQEIIDRLKEAGGTPGHIRDTVGVAHSVTPVSPDILAGVLQAMLEEAGAGYILEGKFLEGEFTGRRLAAVRGVSPAGFFRATARVYVDASGSGTLAAAWGCPFDRGRDGQVMPATLIFSVRDVSLDRVFEYVEKNPGEFHGETLFDHVRKSAAAGVSGFFSLWRDARLPVPRDRLLFYGFLRPGEVAINSTRIPGFEPLDPLSVNGAYLEGRRQVEAVHRFLRLHVPGFEECIVSRIAPFLGVREVRRITGQYVLTAGDLAGGRRFPDEVALGGFPIDIHQPGGGSIESSEVGGAGFYGIPYRCLLPVGAPGLLIAGKCFSADFSAHASARVQATCMAMGQGAGVAAALAVKSGLDPAELDPQAVREGVTRLGGILEPEGMEDLP